MITIRTVDIHQNEIVKKILIKRSSLTHQNFTSRKKITPSSASPLKSPRHNFGLKNSPKNILQHEQSLLNTQEEYYLRDFEAYYSEFDGKDKQKHIHDKEKKFMQMHKNVSKSIDECIEENKCPSEKDTNNSSKNSGSGSLKIDKIEAEYFEEAYQSPRMKLKKLEKQKNVQKQKWLSNIEKVIETEESIKDNRHKNELEVQMFEQIIKNLQKQEKLSSSETFTFENNRLSLLKFRNEAMGRSSLNENFHSPSITNSCEL